jgi:hypothetical protein
LRRANDLFRRPFILDIRRSIYLRTVFIQSSRLLDN